MTMFKNEPFTDFSTPAAREAQRVALDKVRLQLDQTYGVFAAGRWIKTRKTLASLNPSNPAEVIGRAAEAGLSVVDQALEAAHHAFPKWSRVPVTERAGYLKRWAAALRSRKEEMTAWLIYEVGKNWSEADADVAEAIDFLEYYAEQA